MKKLAALVGVIAALVALPAAAHVTVKPAQVGIGSFQTFNVSVPNEKAVPTVGLRLVIPSGLEHVAPTVKTGWSIRTVEQAAASPAAAAHDDGHSDGVVTEIIWTGGRVPEHFRDDFTFGAKVPATPTDLMWKAYQTYSDGTIVAWELAPGVTAGEGTGPASITKVVDDLAAAPASNDEEADDKGKSDDNATFISIVALLVSAFSAYLAKKK